MSLLFNMLSRFAIAFLPRSKDLSISWRQSPSTVIWRTSLGGSDDIGSDCNAGNPGSVPGWGRSPGEGNGYPLQFSCLKNSMDIGTRWVHGLKRIQACSKEAQAGIKIAGRNISNLRYADDTTLMAESKEDLKSLLMRVKKESEKVTLKLSIQKQYHGIWFHHLHLSRTQKESYIQGGTNKS